VLKDIRDTDSEEYWETLRQRWGALLSYRYLGRQFSSMNNVSDDTVTLRHDMRARLQASALALRHGVRRVKILPMSNVDSLSLFYFSPIEHGTEVIATVLHS